MFEGKKVLITGNTGFKGSWLTAWLIKLGANIVGIAKDIPTNPSIFEELKLEDQIKFYKEDVRDLSKMINIPQKDSKIYIDKFFESYPEVREFLDKINKEGLDIT